MKKFNYIEKGIAWVHEHMNERQFLIFSSILVGLSAGLAAVILKLFVSLIRVYLVERDFAGFFSQYIYLLFPVAGIGLAAFIIYYAFKNQLTKGNAGILYAIARKSAFIPFHNMYAHVITSGLTVGFGGSAGLESPIVSTGSAIGSNFARTYKLSYKERTLLLAAGVTGGVAGAFNAPIAGVLFALEVILIDISISAFIPLLIAAASGALISKILLGEGYLLFFSLKQPFNYHNVPLYILLGLLAGMISLYYVNVFERVEQRWKGVSSGVLRWLSGSILLVLIIAIFPALFGEGYESVKALSDLKWEDWLRGSFIQKYVSGEVLTLTMIVLTLLLKPVAAGLTLGSGGNGGNFAPSLFVGACLGFVFAYSLTMLGFDSVPVSNFTLVAMGGVLSGVFHAPLTGIFLIAEITGGYELIIPLMLVSTISYIVVKYFHPDSLEVRRLKQMGAIISENKDTSILSKISIRQVVERDFTTIHFKASLREIVERIKQSKRNIFPVVKKNGKLLGVIYLNTIREEMFNPDLYDQISAREIMQKPGVVVESHEDIFQVMKKFEESGQWNLPVVENGIYIGFLSKSSILDTYRHELLKSV